MADKTINQLKDEEMYLKSNVESNSIANIILHMNGNMLSRWTDFKTQDGEKEWRHRDQEFADTNLQRYELLVIWENGWQCLFDALDSIVDEDLQTIIYIRGEAHSILEAVQRQLAHYPYHVGQIVFIGKELRGQNWESLSIPRNQSIAFNVEKFRSNKEVN